MAALDPRAGPHDLGVEAAQIGAHGLQDLRVGHGHDELHVGSQHDRPDAVVRGDAAVVSAGERSMETPLAFD